jgi:hypothetical protein
MSSISAEFAQVGRRRGYFIATGTVIGYLYTGVTFDVKGITALPSPTASVTTATNVLQDMGESYEFNGQLFRRVRVVTQVTTGGTEVSYLICMPGGEYPIQGYPTASAIAAAFVARLG